MLKLTLSLHRRWILRAASRLGLRPSLPTVHTRDWVEGEPVSVFRESALNELCVFTCRTGRSLRAVPAPSALVAMAHDWQAHKIPQALASVVTCHGGSWDYSSAAARDWSSFNPLPGSVCSGARFCSRVMSGNAFTPFVVHSSLLSQVPTNYPPLLGDLWGSQVEDLSGMQLCVRYCCTELYLGTCVMLYLKGSMHCAYRKSLFRHGIKFFSDPVEKFPVLN